MWGSKARTDANFLQPAPKGDNEVPATKAPEIMDRVASSLAEARHWLDRGRLFRMRAAIAAILVGVSLAIVGTAAAQFGRGGGRFRSRMATSDSYDGRFHYCRAVYRPNPFGDGGDWTTDYPQADIDLSIRLSELTKTPVSFDKSGYPQHLNVRLTDDELYRCPIIIMQEVGRLFFDDTDAAHLRDYLLKGGFLWVDDFWGSYAWDVWVRQIRKVFPPAEFPIVDVPIGHAMFRTLFEVQKLPQIPSINFWLGTGGTSERGADSAQPHARAIFDEKGRAMVFMTHNTDFGDSWEREGEDPRYFYAFSVDGYAVAVDVLLYAMTH